MELRNQIIDFGTAFGYGAKELFAALVESRALLAGPIKALPFLALFLGTSIASASSACLENRPASDSAQYVRVVDAEGGKHRFSVFVLGNEDMEEFGAWMSSRKTAAMTPDLTLYLKTSAGVDSVKSIPRCPSKGARKPFKM